MLHYLIKCNQHNILSNQISDLKGAFRQSFGEKLEAICHNHLVIDTNALPR